MSSDNKKHRMGFFFRGGPVENPELLNDAIDDFSDTVRIYRDIGLPERIEKPTLATPIKRMLRGVYGCSSWGVIWYLALGEFHSLYIRALALTPKCRRAARTIEKEMKDAE